VKKQVAFSPIPPKPAVQAADDWVKSRGSVEEAVAAAPSVVVPLPQAAEPMKRFTIDVTEELHKRIKSQCAQRGAKMADVIRELLEREFPKA